MHTISQRLAGPGASEGWIDAGFFRGRVWAAAVWAAAVWAAAVRGFEILLLWRRRANERHAPARLDDRMLRDLGLSRFEAAWESRKPFWRA